MLARHSRAFLSRADAGREVIPPAIRALLDAVNLELNYGATVRSLGHSQLIGVTTGLSRGHSPPNTQEFPQTPACPKRLIPRLGSPRHASRFSQVLRRKAPKLVRAF